MHFDLAPPAGTGEGMRPVYGGPVHQEQLEDLELVTVSRQDHWNTGVAMRRKQKEESN